MEYASRGIRVNAVSPGIIQTPMYPAESLRGLGSRLPPLGPHLALILTAALTAVGRPLSGQPVSFRTIGYGVITMRYRSAMARPTRGPGQA